MNAIASRPNDGSGERQLMLFVLRIFLGIQSLSFAIAAFAFLGHESPRHATLSVWGMLAITSSLLGLSTLRVVESRWFVPAALGATLLLPAVGQGLAIRQGPAAFEKMSIELAFLLAVPLVLAAWRYSFRLVLALTLGVAVIDAALLALLALSPLSSESRELLGHVLVDRTVVLLIVGYVVSRLVGEQRRQHSALEHTHVQLRRFAASLEQLSISHERNRMARELHDTLAHTLTAITVQLEAASSESKREPGRVDALLRGAAQTARSGLSEVRRALRELRASPVEDLGLVLSIRTLAEQCRERTLASIELRLPEPTLSLPSDVEQGLYRIVQEALSNIERHASAHSVELSLEVDGPRLTLRIVDDGCGFDTSGLAQDQYGLVGLRERAALLGGELGLQSAPGRGTSVELKLAAMPTLARPLSTPLLPPSSSTTSPVAGKPLRRRSSPPSASGSARSSASSQKG